MILFQLLALFVLLLVVLYFTYLKAAEQLALLKETDSRFIHIEDVYDLLRKSQKNFFFYFAFLYLHSPFYVSIGRREFENREYRIKKYLTVVWTSLGFAAILLIVDYVSNHTN